MADDRGKRLPDEALVALRQRLDMPPTRSPERRTLLESTAARYGVSRPTLYRAPCTGICAPSRPAAPTTGRPRKPIATELERAGEIIGR